MGALPFVNCKMELAVCMHIYFPNVSLHATAKHQSLMEEGSIAREDYILDSDFYCIYPHDFITFQPSQPPDTISLIQKSVALAYTWHQKT
jgi:hypothetical protein